MKLKVGHTEQDTVVRNEIGTFLERNTRRDILDLQWIQGHAGLEGNKIAGKVAKVAAGLNQAGVLMDIKTAVAIVKEEVGTVWNRKFEK